MRRLIAICAAVLALGATPAQAAFDDPLFVFTPIPGEQKSPLKPPPSAQLEGPCGLGVDSQGRFYVSDYYHHAVDLYNGSANYTGSNVNGATGYVAQLANEDPLDGPCGLALDPSNNLYVNNYHRNVVKFGPAGGFAPGPVFDTAHPTGVATDSAGHVYVDDCGYVAEYDSTGALVRKIGEGSLQDGYGLAVSAYPSSAGRVYVPDAATDTVKAYDPATSTTNPVQTITGPPGGFKSLTDSAIAVDDASGEVYVIDTLGPQLSEKPQATVHVFSSAGAYEGRLKHNVINGAPSGLAVDNSPTATQSRVYVTSGISSFSSIYAYAPHSATSKALPPIGLSTLAGAGGVAGSAGIRGQALESASSAPARSSAISQQGNLRVSLTGKLSPHKLPRKGSAPIAVSVGGQISTTDGSSPPELKRISIEINRNGRIDSSGLPICPIAKIQPASTSRALANCRSSLVGDGDFSALVDFGEAESGQLETYETKGRLLLFNGRQGKKPVLFGQIYASRPFATSFVIPFAVKRIEKGRFGTLLSAALPAALRNWGNLTGLEMTLSRRYGYGGKQHSYVSAGCPAPKGFGAAVFPLARSTFAFEGGVSISSTLTDQCRVRG